MFGLGDNDNDNQRRNEGRSEGESPNLGGNATHGGSYPASGYRADSDDEDFERKAAEHASRHAGDSGSSDMFSGLLSAIGQKKPQLANEDVDEEDAVRQHKRFFGSGDDDRQEADERSMGSAAAMQALKMFSGGSTGGGHENNSRSAFIGLAMAQASKLFDQQAAQGKVSNDASKESAISKAGEMALKMYMKQKLGGSSSGGGGASSLMSLASKFM